jgi:DNA-directed RNA polymerase specialized sigma24 family protein
LQQADPEPSPAETLPLRETIAEFRAGLTEGERPVVLLRLEGRSVAEAAEQLGCSEPTVLHGLAGVRARVTGLLAPE